MVAFLRRCLTNPKSSVRNGLLWACFALYAFSVEAGGANFQSRFVEAIQAAFPANGYINKEIHDSVWDAAPPELLMELDNPKAAAAFKMQAKKLFGHAMLFQYATWENFHIIQTIKRFTKSLWKKAIQPLQTMVIE